VAFARRKPHASHPLPFFSSPAISYIQATPFPFPFSRFLPPPTLSPLLRPSVSVEGVPITPNHFMPNIDQGFSLLPSRRSLSPSKKTGPRTVLGISNILFHRPDNSPLRSQPALPKPPVAARRSLSTRRRRNPRADTQNINTLSFLEFDSTIHVENTPPSPSISSMTASQERQARPARRQVLRVDAQDGPWTVSVAENHHRPSSFTLYVKSECTFTKELSGVFFCLSRCSVPVGVSHFPFHLMWDGSLGSIVLPISSWAQLCPRLPNLDMMAS
jgi:hypothetical protein